MNEIQILREQIDIIDDKLVELFEKRILLTKKIGDIKKQNGIEMVDTKREEEIINRGISILKNKDLSSEAKLFLRNIIELSKKVQQKRGF